MCGGVAELQVGGRGFGVSKPLGQRDSGDQTSVADRVDDLRACCDDGRDDPGEGAHGGGSQESLHGCPQGESAD